MGASEQLDDAHFHAVRAFPRLKAPSPRSRCTVPRPGGSSSLVAGSQCPSQVRHMLDDTRYTSRRDNEKRVEYDWRGDGALQKSFVTATYVKVQQKKNCLSSCNTRWSFLPNPVVGMQVRIELSHIVILRVRNGTCVVRSNQIVTPYLESGKRSVISRCRQH